MYHNVSHCNQHQCIPKNSHNKWKQHSLYFNFPTKWLSRCISLQSVFFDGKFKFNTIVDLLQTSELRWDRANTKNLIQNDEIITAIILPQNSPCVFGVHCRNRIGAPVKEFVKTICIPTEISLTLTRNRSCTFAKYYRKYPVYHGNSFQDPFLHSSLRQVIQEEEVFPYTAIEGSISRVLWEISGWNRHDWCAWQDHIVII